MSDTQKLNIGAIVRDIETGYRYEYTHPGTDEPFTALDGTEESYDLLEVPVEIEVNP